MKIDKDQIVAEALLLLNERGLDGVTTRALADRLGVKQPALYWHFKDRRALLDAMNDVIEAQMTVFIPQATGLPWQDFVFALGCAFRNGLMAYRDGGRVHAGSRANRMQLEQFMSVLVAAGFPVPLAIQLLVAVGRFVVGWVVEEQADSAAPPATMIPPPGLAGAAIRAFFEAGDEASFTIGLRMMIDGAALHLGRP